MHEVYYEILISEVIVVVSYWHQIDMEQIDNHDFYIIVVDFVAILLIFLGLSFDLRSRTKITIYVASINIAIFITNSMLKSTHFITQTFTLIISCLCILLLVYKYKATRYFLLVVLICLSVFCIQHLSSRHSF